MIRKPRNTDYKRLAELKKIINDQKYMDTALSGIAERVTKSFIAGDFEYNDDNSNMPK